MIANELDDPCCFACGLFRVPTLIGVQKKPAKQPDPGGPQGSPQEGLVAYALFKVSPGTADMSRFAVAPHARRKGLGSKLLRHSLVHLFGLGVLEVFLEVRSNNRSAIALYRSHGFLQVGQRPAYYPDGTGALVLRACRHKIPDLT